MYTNLRDNILFNRILEKRRRRQVDRQKEERRHGRLDICYFDAWGPLRTGTTEKAYLDQYRNEASHFPRHQGEQEPAGSPLEVLLEMLRISHLLEH
jgi:hypothetical protein